MLGKLVMFFVLVGSIAWFVLSMKRDMDRHQERRDAEAHKKWVEDGMAMELRHDMEEGRRRDY